MLNFWKKVSAYLSFTNGRKKNGAFLIPPLEGTTLSLAKRSQLVDGYLQSSWKKPFFIPRDDKKDRSMRTEGWEHHLILIVLNPFHYGPLPKIILKCYQRSPYLIEQILSKALLECLSYSQKNSSKD